MEEWKKNLVTDQREIEEILRTTHSIAVLGIKPESRADRAAHSIPRYMAEIGYEIKPVPVYYPDVEEILGKPVHRTVREVAPVDMVNVFRRPWDIPQHVDDIIAAKPKYVWFQLGIRNDEAAERLAKAGIKVVQNRCISVEHSRLR